MKYFKNKEEIHSHINNKKKGYMMIIYENVKDYEGMVFELGVIYDIHKNLYQLDLKWMCMALDFYSDTLVENYLYEFDDINAIIDYIDVNYNVLINHIPIQFEIDENLFPSPLKDKEKRPIFEANWQRFQQEFKSNKYLDTNLKLIYSSLE